MKQYFAQHSPLVWKKDSSLVPASARQSVGGVIESTETWRHVKGTYSDDSSDMERWETNVALREDRFLRKKKCWEILQCDKHCKQLK